MTSDDRPGRQCDPGVTRHYVRLSTKDLKLLILNGAEGQDRTADTTIFNRVLYQLSYLGTRAPNEPSGTLEVYKTPGQ